MLPEDQLAKHRSLTLSKLTGRPIASCRLERVPTRPHNDFLAALSACPEHMRYVCDSPEAAIAVAATGAAISIQPSNIMPPDLGLIARPLTDINPVGFGAYAMGKGGPLALRLVELIGERMRAGRSMSPSPGHPC